MRLVGECSYTIQHDADMHAGEMDILVLTLVSPNTFIIILLLLFIVGRQTQCWCSPITNTMIVIETQTQDIQTNTVFGWVWAAFCVSVTQTASQR